jgi:predicted nucleic acid-binding protein
LRIVVDTNILFSYFWEKSITKRIINLQPFEFYTPNFAFQEIKKYKKEIILKTKITEKEYLKIILELKNKIIIINEKEYFSKIKNITHVPDVNDIDFIALSNNLDKVLWSNDKKLKEQNYTLVLNAEELLKIMFKLKITI